jgi:hypothetical protein
MKRHGQGCAITEVERDDNSDFIYYNIVINNPTSSVFPMQHTDTRADILYQSLGFKFLEEIFPSLFGLELFLLSHFLQFLFSLVLLQLLQI